MVENGSENGQLPPEASDHEVVRFKIAEFKVSFRNPPLGAFLRSNWKVESLRNPVSKELASEDASIGSYSDFESDRSAVGRLRRRASAGKGCTSYP